MKNELKKTNVCSLKKSPSVTLRGRMKDLHSSDSVTLLEQTICAWPTLWRQSLICLTHKVAICVTYDKRCQRSPWRQLKRFNCDSLQCLPAFWATLH